MTNKPTLKLVNSAQKPRKIIPNKDNSRSSGNGGGSGSSKTKRFGDYTIKDGAFYQIKAVRSGEDGNGTVEFPLCDFTCQIVEEVTADDGLVDSTFLRIKGLRKNGFALPLVDVPAKSFYSSQGSWSNEYWGTQVFIFPGAAKKDNLRACIHLFSNLNGDVPRRTVYKYSGWKKINDAWHYLTGSGAITVDGLIEGTEVDLGSGHMSRYQLPAPLAGDRLKQAVSDTLALLDVCPGKLHIGAALLAAVARAPLGECHCVDFALWLHGLTGSRKSAITAIALAFFGDFTARSFPGNWSDSVNDAEAKSHQCKDSIFVMDDFKPSVSLTESSKLHAMAERIVRNTGNQTGRGRRGSAMEAKAAPYNRSMMLITGEDLPRGQSLLGRLLILEIGGSDVDNAVLTRLQQAQQAGSFTGLMSAYLQWLAGRMDQLKKDLPKNIALLRDAAIRDGLATSHPRAAEMYVSLVAGFDVFLEFLEDTGTITNEQSTHLSLSIESSLQQAFSEQADYQKDQCEAQRFVQLLKAALSSGNCHIADKNKQGAPETRPFVWGWRNGGKDLSGDVYSPMGDCIGWYCAPLEGNNAEVWLQQDAVFKVVQQFARNQGEAFLMSPATLWRRLDEKLLILQTEQQTGRAKPRLSVKKFVGGRYVRVMVLGAELIESD